MDEPSYEGGCLCGAIRYRVRGPGTNRAFCHCRSCRLAAGAPCVAWATFPEAGLEWLRGEPALYRSSAHVVRGFCSACGTALTYRHDRRAGEFDLSLATLDEPAAIAPEFHIWLSHRLPWLELSDGLPGHAEWSSA